MAHLIIGGSSGLGLELAKKWSAGGQKVTVTGRTDPQEASVAFKPFELHAPDLPDRIKKFLDDLTAIDTLVYAAGTSEEGRITDLSDDHIEEMLSVGGRAEIYFVKYLLAKQGRLKELITISSTSQWKPRQLEPIYNFVKAGQSHLSNGLAEDDRIGKVLVVSPAGMDTPFWRAQPERDTSDFLDPSWVAGQTIDLLNDNFKFKLAKLERNPARVEIVESR